MKALTLRLVIVAVLLATGWAAGRAQTASPDFEFVITTVATDSSVETSVDCVRGCNLAWVQRGVNQSAKAIKRFEYACRGAGQCPSGVIGGWIEK